MRAGRIGRTVGRTVAIALFGLTVTVAGIVGVQAATSDDYQWDVSPPGSSPTGDWGSVLNEAAATASDYQWD